MLQAIRSRASSFVVKILFGLLIVTFGVWGIGDIFRSRSADTTVATVGGRAISAEVLNERVRQQIDRLRGVFGSIDADQAKQLGLVDQALQSLIATNLVELEIGRLGLAVGDQAVRDAILANPAFRNQAGGFDRNLYNQILVANHLTEAQFEAMQRSDLLKAQLTSSLAAGVTPPKELIDTLYRARAERRVADVLTLPPDAAGAIAKPSEAEIDAYYQAHKDQFQAPERRSFKVAMLRLDDVAAGIEITDSDLRDGFKQRQDEYHTPEERQIQQMLLPDEANANIASSQLALGKNFAAVAKDVAKMDDPAALDLGWTKRSDLPPELADAAFALAEGKTTPPIKSSFGWHILRVVAIKPAQDQDFDQIKDKLRTEIARDRASDHMADLANTIDDTIAGGASLDDVAKKFSLKTVTAAAVDHDGKDAAGTAAALGEGRETILKTAFATDKGQTSSLSEMGDEGFYIVQVEAVAPAAAKPLAEVHDQAAKLAEDETRQQALQKLADAIAQEVAGGKSLKDVAAARKLAVTATPPLQRTGGDPKTPPSLVAKLFDAKPGAAVTDAGPTGVMVAQLQSIEPADPAKDAAAVNQLTRDLGSVMQSDVMSEYDQALRRTFPVEVNQANLDHVL